MTNGLTVSDIAHISDDVFNFTDDLVALRRELHQFPETGFQEKRTQRRILEILDGWGIAASASAGTGVVGTINGQRPGKVLLLRADIDALPITEETAVPWKSKHAGVMHACGHDAHAAILLAVARLLNNRGLSRGTVKLVFQPAEEGLGGAQKMIDEGILDNPKVDAALAVHVWTQFPVGQVAAVAGPVAASVDGFRIVIAGKGTHAAVPEDGVDPVAIAAQLITVAQSLITRRLSPLQPAVLSFTSVRAGNAFNVIPETAEILGTFRTFDAQVRARLRTDLEQLAKALAGSFGATAEYTSLVEHIPVLNDPAMVDLVRHEASAVVGPSGLIAPSPLMVGEDMGEILECVPGALVLLGCGNSAIGADFPHHHPRFNIDERVLPIGVELALRCVSRFSQTDR